MRAARAIAHTVCGMCGCGTRRPLLDGRRHVEENRPVSYTTFKRWRLRPAASLEQVADLVRAEIAPHYSTLSERVTLGLDRVVTENDQANVIIAIQRWDDRVAFDAAFNSDGFATWWQEYQPTLERWGALVEFEDEWETESVL